MCNLWVAQHSGRPLDEQPHGCGLTILRGQGDYVPGQISISHWPITRIAWAHSVVPLLQTSQTSGTAKPGHGSVTGPASWQSVVHSKYPLERLFPTRETQLQDVEHPPGPLLAVPHPSPGEQAAPWVQPPGGGGGGSVQLTPH
jgi:hypothetical protein